MNFRILFAALALPCHAVTLAPMIVTGDKLNRDVNAQTGLYTLLDQDFLTSLPINGGTYQTIFGTVAGGYSGNPTAGPFSLRGLNQDNVFGYVGTSSNSLIAVLEDGAPLSSATLRYLPPLLWDLEQVEVLRGPQSLSHGPNSLGGAILLDTASPSFFHTGKGFAEISEDATYHGGIAQNLILLPDELALRLSYQHQESDGQATNLFSNDDEYGATQRDRFQARLLWHPGKNPDHQLDLSLVHDRANGSPFATVSEAPGRDLFARETSLNTPSSYPVERNAATLNATFALPGDLQLKSTTSAQRFDLEQSFDLDATPFLNWFVNGFTDETRFTEDLTIAKREGDFQWLLGSYYEHSRYGTGFSGRGLAPFPAGSPFTNGAEETVEMLALYGRLDWEFVKNFHLTGGLRINHEDREINTSAKLGPFPQVLASNDTAETNLLPQLGLAWRPDEDRTLGIQVARGYRGGGVSYAPTLGLTQAYDAEYAWDAEIHARFSPVEDLNLSAALFYSWMDDQQVPVQVPGGFPGVDTLITNAASSRRYGAELEAAWRAHETLTFRSSLSYIQTEFTDLTLNGADRSGQAFPNAPEWIASLAADYRHPSGFFGSALYSWADSAYSFVNSPQVTALESRSLLSARVGYTWENASLYVFGSNLFDDEYALLRADQSASGLPVSGKVGAPRMFGVGCEFRW
jgi:iron complex outermembrane recepter protein